MAQARVEFVRLGIGPLHSGGWTNLIEGTPAGVVNLDVASSPTASNDRPVVPSFGGKGDGHARVTALLGAIVVAWGADPTASEAGIGLRLEPHTTEYLPVKAGDRLSFVEVL